MLPENTKAKFLRIDIADNERQAKYLDQTLKPLYSTPRKNIKPRYTAITMQLPGSVPIDSTSLSHDMRHIVIMSGGMSITPVETTIENFYYRDNKKEKILNKFWLYNERPPADIHVLLARYSAILAIDTNTYTYPSVGTVSVTTAAIGSIRHLEHGYLLGDCKHYYSAYRMNVAGNPEVIAWADLIERLLKQYHGQRYRMAIVVDSELDDLASYNSRDKPIIQDQYLPERIELAFATDASGAAEYLPNKLITLCHKASERAKVELEKKYGWR